MWWKTGDDSQLHQGHINTRCVLKRTSGCSFCFWWNTNMRWQNLRTTTALLWLKGSWTKESNRSHPGCRPDKDHNPSRTQILQLWVPGKVRWLLSGGDRSWINSGATGENEEEQVKKEEEEEATGGLHLAAVSAACSWSLLTFYSTSRCLSSELLAGCRLICTLMRKHACT